VITVVKDSHVLLMTTVLPWWWPFVHCFITSSTLAPSGVKSCQLTSTYTVSVSYNRMALAIYIV